MRAALVEKLHERLPDRDFSYMLAQRGMFSYSGSTKAQVLRLRERILDLRSRYRSHLRGGAQFAQRRLRGRCDRQGDDGRTVTDRCPVETRVTTFEWPFAVRPLTPALGVEVVGVDLAKEIDPPLFRALYDAFCAIRCCCSTPGSSRPRGRWPLRGTSREVQVHVMNQYHADGFPEIYRLSNLDEHGRPNGRHPDKGTLAWHTDGSWKPITGQATIIYGEVVPDVGGETHFCDMYGGYERLDNTWKARIANLRAVHNLDFSRTRRHGEDPMTEAQKRATPPVDHPIVRTHPRRDASASFSATMRSTCSACRTTRVAP
jgi:taurine dioxygenase